MRNIIIFIYLTIAIHTIANSQSCLEEGITFTSQSQIDNFQLNYPGCIEIEGDVLITLDDIVNLNELEILEAIGGSLSIEECDQLTNLEGLSNITSIGHDLNIQMNGMLVDLNDFSALSTIGGAFLIRNNGALHDLNGINNLMIIEENLFIASNPNLVSLVGLENLEEVQGDLLIYNNSNLESLNGLESLITIDGRLSIEYNGSINSIGIPDLIEVSGDLNVFYSPVLETISGFDNLETVGGTLNIWHNVNLTDISGFANIDETSITDLYISENISLSQCAIQSVCDYLSYPGCNVAIQINAPGCNSKEEVAEACEAVSFSDKGPKPEYLIFPNPSEKRFSISGDLTSLKEVNIYNQLGEKVFSEKRITNTIDILILPQGMYIVELVSNDTVTRKKLIHKLQ